MKKAISLLVLLIVGICMISATMSPRTTFSQEFSYIRYNNTWVSPTLSKYTVESIAVNPTIRSELDIMFCKYIGVTVGLGGGYQIGIFDKNRFVTFPKNINGTLSTGIALRIDGFRLAISAALRSSFQTARNAWLSQVGGIADFSYIFDNGLLFQTSFNYFYSYEIKTCSLSFCVGYGFGGKK